MIGVTIGIGEKWEKLAKISAQRMSDAIGLKCRVITSDDFGAVHPSWLKCHIHRIFPEEDAFLVFDADVLAFRAWDPEDLFEAMRRPFMAVPEPNMNDVLLAECAEWRLGYPDVYVNGGLLIYGREHGFIWDRVWNMHPNGGRWLEQTALNRVLVDEAVEICRLPRHFNLLAQKGRIQSIYSRSTLKDAINVHTCALRDAETVLEIHESLLAYRDSGQAGRTRAELLWDLRERFGYGESRGAEIGVFAGDFSRDIVKILGPAELCLVDLFEGHVTSGDVNGQNMRTIDMAKRRLELVAELPDACICAMDSIEWLRAMPAASLDWVYLDTDHEYERTACELAEALRVVRPGGVIAGHDFSSAFPGVVRAVREFCAQHGLPLRVYDGDLLPSFAIEM